MYPYMYVHMVDLKTHTHTKSHLVLLVSVFLHEYSLWKGKEITTIIHLKTQMWAWSSWSMKLDLIYAQRGKPHWTSITIDFFFFKQCFISSPFQRTVSILNNYLGGTMQSFERSSLYTYQMSIIICCNSPTWLYTVAISFLK